MFLVTVTIVLAIAGILVINTDLSSTPEIEGPGSGSGPLQDSGTFQIALTGDMARSFEDVITSLINAFKTVVMGFVELDLSPIKAI